MDVFGRLIVRKINHESGIKWVPKQTEPAAWKSSGKQARYNWICSSEGNTVAKRNNYWAIMDRSVDFGRRIGITRRNSVRSEGLTGHYNCGFQLHSSLKVERQSLVQVVLLLDTNESTKICSVKETRRVVMEASHRVVQYFWVQKIWNLKENHYFDLIHKH